MKTYSLPESTEEWIAQHLKDTGLNLKQPKDLAKAILKVSDAYQVHDSVTDWKDNQTRAAYLSYFFPLNYIRFLRVIDQIKTSHFFSGIDQVIDFGCGPGPSTKALSSDKDFNFLTKIHGIDNHNEVRSDYLDTPRSKLSLSFGKTKPPGPLNSTAIIASYAINELESIPHWFFDAEALVILEPSTKSAFKRFDELRSNLLNQGYHLWAPCPHMDTCPLSLSKKDWCHDRVHWTQPQWFQNIENQLPIKNTTLTYSYLLARKTKKETDDRLRVVGDSLLEKGKTRWMLCRSSEREFLSFLHRNGKPPQIYRGDSLQLNNYEKKGNELRIKKEDIVLS